MSRLKLIGQLFLFGCLTVAIITIGVFVSLIAVVLIPFLLVFTALWVIWLCIKE